MKILYVFFHSYSDMPYHTREWVEAAVELGHDVTVVSAIDPAFLKTIDWDGKINIIQVLYPGSGILNYLKLLKNFKSAISAELRNSRKYDLIYERFSQISPATAKVAEMTGTKYCTEINGIIERELALSGASLLRRMFFKHIQKRVYGKCDAIITVTKEIKKWIVNHYGVPDEKIKSISNGVNTKRFQPCDKIKARQKFAIPEDRFVVGFLGSLYPWSGLNHLVDAAEMIIKEKQLADTLFLIGGGQQPMKSELEAMVRERKLEEYFIFSGQIPWKDAPEFISTFDVGCEPKMKSMQTSFSPLKIFSYCACGVPFIASDIPEIKENFASIDQKCYFPSGDAEALAQKIREFRDLPDEKIRELRENARQCVVENHTWEKVVADTLRFAGKEILRI